MLVRLRAWEQKVLDAPGADDRVGRIEDELRAALRERPAADRSRTLVELVRIDRCPTTG
jgi:hypothetical protein